MGDESNDLDALVKVRMLRLNATIQGIAAGAILGLGLFVATNWLLIKGGPVVGPNLSLLGQFFPGYRVSFGGSLIGLAYGFGLGFVIGYIVARIYNLLVDVRQEPNPDTKAVGTAGRR